MNGIKQKEWRDLKHTAAQCRPIRTNPASYSAKELEIMETQALNTEKHMADRCMKLCNALMKIEDETNGLDKDTDFSEICETVNEIAQKALRTD